MRRHDTASYQAQSPAGYSRIPHRSGIARSPVGDSYHRAGYSSEPAYPVDQNNQAEGIRKMYVEYSSNNSGGTWWLTDNDWRALANAGWEVEWYEDQKDYNGKDYPEGRFLDALASHAKREGLSLGDAIEEWERVTGQDSSALGCSCCGTPHSFTEYDDDGKYVDSYYPSFPLYGDRYGE